MNKRESLLNALERAKLYERQGRYSEARTEYRKGLEKAVGQNKKTSPPAA